MQMVQIYEAIPLCFSLILCPLLLQERSAVFFWKKKIVLLLSGKFDYQQKFLSS